MHGLKVNTVKTQLLIAVVGHMHNVLAVQGILGRAGGGSCFLHPQAILVVGEADRFAALAHALQLAPLSPGIGPSAITQRIANGVVGDCRTIDGRQLVLPVRIAIAVAVGFHRRANSARCIRISGLAQDVAAQIIGIHPSRAIAACRGVIGIVGSDQLAQQIVGIADRLDAIADAGDVARIVIGIGQHGTGLGNGLHQRRGAARAVAASQIAVSRGNAGAARIDSTTGDTAQTVIDISGEKGGASEEAPPKQEK